MYVWCFELDQFINDNDFPNSENLIKFIQERKKAGDEVYFVSSLHPPKQAYKLFIQETFQSIFGNDITSWYINLSDETGINGHINEALRRAKEKHKKAGLDNKNIIFVYSLEEHTANATAIPVKGMHITEYNGDAISALTKLISPPTYIRNRSLTEIFIDYLRQFGEKKDRSTSKNFWGYSYFYTSFVTVFGEERQTVENYNMQKGKKPVIAKRKLLNPFKWLHFILFEIPYASCKTIAVECFIAADKKLNEASNLDNNSDDTDDDKSFFSLNAQAAFLNFQAGFLKFIAYFFNLAELTLALPLVIARPIFMPTNFIIRPIARHMFEQKRWISGALLLSGVILVTAFVLLSILSGGTLPLGLSTIGFLATMAQGISFAATFIATKIALLGISAAIATPVTQAAITIVSLFTSATLFREIATLFCNLIDKIKPPIEVAQPEKQPSSSYSKLVQRDDFENISSLLYNTPLNFPPLEKMNVLNALQSFVGLNPIRKGANQLQEGKGKEEVIQEIPRQNMST